MVSGKHVSVIIPAEGSGTRIGGGIAKQFIELQGKPILAWTIRKFQLHPAVDSIVIAGSADGIQAITTIVNDLHASKVEWIGLGGEYRQDSVWNALQQIDSKQNGIVLVHDAVRPFVSDTIIDRVLSATSEYGAALPAIRPKDTIKISEDGVFVGETVNRDNMRLVQTPQGFEVNLLLRAYVRTREANYKGTDDASLVERIGVKVTMVEGSYDNIKITTPEDLEIAACLAKTRITL